jgi:hypothetical protein
MHALVSIALTSRRLVHVQGPNMLRGYGPEDSRVLFEQMPSHFPAICDSSQMNGSPSSVLVTGATAAATGQALDISAPEPHTPAFTFLGGSAVLPSSNSLPKHHHKASPHPEALGHLGPQGSLFECMPPAHQSPLSTLHSSAMHTSLAGPGSSTNESTLHHFSGSNASLNSIRYLSQPLPATASDFTEPPWHLTGGTEAARHCGSHRCIQNMAPVVEGLGEPMTTSADPAARRVAVRDDTSG